MLSSCVDNEREGVSMPSIGTARDSDTGSQDLMHLNTLIDENALAAEAYFKRAKLFSLSQSEKALVDINQALALEPNAPAYLFLKSRILKYLKNNTEALQTAESAGAAGLDSPIFYVHLAQLYLDLDSLVMAKEYIDEALNMVPNLNEALLVKANLQIRSERSENALWTLKEALILDAKNPDTYDLLAKAYLDLGKLDSAYRNNERGHKLIKTQHPGLLYNKAKIWERLGRTDSAITNYNRLIVISPDLEAPHIDIAEIYLRKSYFNRAYSSFEKAIKKSPNQKSIYLRAGYCLERLSKFKDAQEFYLKAKTKFPEDEAILAAFEKMTNRVQRQYRSTNI